MGEVRTLKCGASLVPLRRIHHPLGDVFHALKASESISFHDFGEAYFTTIRTGATKGWKKHTKMVMNLVVPAGRVRFHLHDEVTHKTEVVELGPETYFRITVPPGLWMAFEGLEGGLNLVLNIASMEHNPAEAINVGIDHFPLGLS